MRILIIALIASAIMANAQNLPGGTINGKPIPASVFTSANVCERLNGTIRQTAQDEAARDMGITATPEDIAAVRQHVQNPDTAAESQRIVEHTRLMISALTAVDRGQDAHQVYVTMLQPQNVPEQEWAAYQVQWKDPAQRAKIEKRLTITPQAVAKGIAAVDFRPAATARKLEAAIDQELAAKDPRYRTALEHWKATEYAGPNGQVGHRGYSQPEKDNMDQQRAAFWRGRVSKLNVVLNDPSLHDKCGLAQIGVAPTR